jgi:hypothetical protein
MEMKYALNLAHDGRILSATYPKYAPQDAVVVDALPEGDLHDYRYVDGEFIYDPIPVEEVEEEPSLEEQVAELREALDMLLTGVTE